LAVQVLGTSWVTTLATTSSKGSGPKGNLMAYLPSLVVIVMESFLAFTMAFQLGFPSLVAFILALAYPEVPFPLVVASDFRE
jgi:hypothetical protein